LVGGRQIQHARDHEPVALMDDREGIRRGALLQLGERDAVEDDLRAHEAIVLVGLLGRTGHVGGHLRLPEEVVDRLPGELEQLLVHGEHELPVDRVVGGDGQRHVELQTAGQQQRQGQDRETSTPHTRGSHRAGSSGVSSGTAAAKSPVAGWGPRLPRAGSHLTYTPRLATPR
jgi:hypothetical protein